MFTFHYAFLLSLKAYYIFLRAYYVETPIDFFCFVLFYSSAFLAEQFESLQSHLDTMMPAAKKPFLQQFYSQVLYTLIHMGLDIFLGIDDHINLNQ